MPRSFLPPPRAAARSDAGAIPSRAAIISAREPAESTQMPTDTETIRRVLAGDVESFRLLVREYQGPVTRLVRNLVPDAHACEDIAQDVFLTAYQKLDQFRPRRGRFGSWLLTIARNKCLNALAKKRPQPISHLPERIEDRTPPDELTAKEIFERFDRALADLPVEQKTAFVLAELVGLPSRQVAEIEGVKPGTIRSRVSRSKEALRSRLCQFARGDS